MMRLVSRVNIWPCLVWISLIFALIRLEEVEASSTDPTPPTQDDELILDVEPVDPQIPPKRPEAEVKATKDVTVTNGKQSTFKAICKSTEMDFTLAGGVRKDDFQWSIAGNRAGGNPNILSELTWSDVESYQLSLTNRTIVNHRFYFRGELNYAFIQSGRIQDSDYREDNRGDEYSRSISDCSGDQIWDLSLAAGYPLYFNQKRLMVAPLFGLSYHKQNFRITDGEQVITWSGGPDRGPLEGLDSTYRATWFGPWIGCDLRYQLPGSDNAGNLPMEFGFSVEFHYADYEAEANWNLRSDFDHPVSFEHETEGYGIALAGAWLIGLSEHWDFLFRTTYQSWETDDGVDKVHYSDNTSSRTRLNSVEWRNYSFMAGVNFYF